MSVVNGEKIEGTLIMSRNAGVRGNFADWVQNIRMKLISPTSGDTKMRTVKSHKQPLMQAVPTRVCVS